jgi:hypothetical protein
MNNYKSDSNLLVIAVSAAWSTGTHQSLFANVAAILARGGGAVVRTA